MAMDKEGLKIMPSAALRGGFVETAWIMVKVGTDTKQFLTICCVEAVETGLSCGAWAMISVFGTNTMSNCV
jgi:hypothetical protein